MLRLSKMTDYAVVMLGAMARADRPLLSAAEISESSGVPEPTVAKIMKALVKTDIVNSVRGVNGGYKLSAAPDKISVSSVVAAVEGDVALTDCVDGAGDSCPLCETCIMKGKWNPLNAAIKAALDKVTLAEMIR